MKNKPNVFGAIGFLYLGETIFQPDLFFPTSMHYNIEKELLHARLHYLEAMKNKPGFAGVPEVVLETVRERIDSGEVETYMGVESLFNYLLEKEPRSGEGARELASELLTFIEQ